MTKTWQIAPAKYEANVTATLKSEFEGIKYTGSNQTVELNVVNNDPSSSIIENNSKDNLKYLFYNYNNSEWNYIIKINNSNTGVLLGSNVSIDSARDCFDRLEFIIE